MWGLFYCEHCRVILWLDYMDDYTKCVHMCPVCKESRKFYSTEREP